MRALRAYGYWLLVVLLLGILGCAVWLYLSKGGQLTTDLVPVHVPISANCAVPDTVDVPLGNTVIWDPPSSNGHTYSANFTTTPFYFSSTYTVPAGSPGKQVTGNLLCNKLTVNAVTSTSLCYFPYTLYKENNKECKDPGVRVIPQ